jgi:hypothetical protein
VYCDSQIYPWIPLLSESLSRTVYALRSPIDLRQVAYERPDIVIDQLVERALYIPAEQPLRWLHGAARPCAGAGDRGS